MNKIKCRLCNIYREETYFYDIRRRIRKTCILCLQKRRCNVSDEYYKLCTSCKMYIRVKRFRDNNNIICKMCIKCRRSQQRYTKSVMRTRRNKKKNRIYIPDLPLIIYI